MPTTTTTRSPGVLTVAAFARTSPIRFTGWTAYSIAHHDTWAVIYSASRPRAIECRAESLQPRVQLFLADIGPIGFDPTYVVVTSTEHVRLAIDRSHFDATPTSGTNCVENNEDNVLRVGVAVTRL